MWFSRDFTLYGSFYATNFAGGRIGTSGISSGRDWSLHWERGELVVGLDVVLCCCRGYKLEFRGLNCVLERVEIWIGKKIAAEKLR
jgi:hypothetical protein